ncbi:hypothetical protein BH11MYX1_BH11MYX1_40890 [soil metagenome]
MKRFSAWLFAPAPVERLAALRIAIGAYAFIYTLSRVRALVTAYAGSFEAVGVVRMMVPSSLELALVVATLLLLALFTLGVEYWLTAPLAAAAVLWTLTYRNAWGQVFHVENLLVLHVIALAAAPAADVWALSRRRVTAGSYGWAIKLLVVLTVATYVLAGIAKLRLAGGAWLDGEQLRNQIAIDNGRKLLLGEAPARLALPLLAHPAWFTAASIATLGIELGAPIALLGGRLGRAWALAAWLFHAGVLALMHIGFPYPLFGVAFLPLLRPDRWIAGMRQGARGVQTR